MNRRDFIIGAGASALAFSANNRINVAVVGLRGRGRNLIENFALNPTSRVVALCDIDDEQIRRGLELTKTVQNSTPSVFKDIRNLLEERDIDVVAVATCSHWHALATVWACQAGKEGVVGELYMAKGLCYKRHPSIPEEAKP